jgi:hypothetical protein
MMARLRIDDWSLYLRHRDATRRAKKYAGLHGAYACREIADLVGQYL